MESLPITDVHSGISSIVLKFSEASGLFERWRRGGRGKKAVGQEECETSLYEGKLTIERALERFLQQHGARFARGDRQCLDSLISTRKCFCETVVDILTRCVAGKLSKGEKVYPLKLIQISEATRKDTITAMDELSRRIVSGTAGPYTVTDPGDVLPHMPLLPTPPSRPPDANSSLQQSLIADTPREDWVNNSKERALSKFQTSQALLETYSPENPSSSKTYLGTPVAPIPQRNQCFITSPIWRPPSFGTFQTLARIGQSTSAIASPWKKGPVSVHSIRPYYDIAPAKPTLDVIPSFECESEASDILEEGRRVTQQLWNAVDYAEIDRLRLQAHSAPIPQIPWKAMFGDEDSEDEGNRDDENNNGEDSDDDDGDTSTHIFLSQSREIIPPADEDYSQMFLRPVLQAARPSSVQGRRRIRSAPMLEFSAPTPRFRRKDNGQDIPVTDK